MRRLYASSSRNHEPTKVIDTETRFTIGLWSSRRLCVQATAGRRSVQSYSCRAMPQIVISRCIVDRSCIFIFICFFSFCLQLFRYSILFSFEIITKRTLAAQRRSRPFSSTKISRLPAVTIIVSARKIFDKFPSMGPATFCSGTWILTTRMFLTNH